MGDDVDDLNLGDLGNDLHLRPQASEATASVCFFCHQILERPSTQEVAGRMEDCDKRSQNRENKKIRRKRGAGMKKTVPDQKGSPASTADKDKSRRNKVNPNNIQQQS